MRTYTSTRINYRRDESVMGMRNYIIDCMVEEDFREDGDFALNLGGDFFSKDEICNAYYEDVLVRYNTITEYDCGDAAYIEEMEYVEKHYNYTFA